MSTRKLKRRHLLYYLPIVDEDTGAKLGNVVDITVEGLMLVSDKNIEAGQEFNLRMDLPQPARGKTSISFAAESLWSKPDPNPSFHDTGFRFTDIDPADAMTIQYLIDRFGFND